MLAIVSEPPALLAIVSAALLAIVSEPPAPEMRPVPAITALLMDEGACLAFRALPYRKELARAAEVHWTGGDIMGHTSVLLLLEAVRLAHLRLGAHHMLHPSNVAQKSSPLPGGGALRLDVKRRGECVRGCRLRASGRLCQCPRGEGRRKGQVPC